MAFLSFDFFFLSTDKSLESEENIKRAFMTIKVKVEFFGGLDIISNHEKNHKCALPFEEGQATMKDLIKYVTENVIKDPKDVPVFIENNSIRPGILVLINDTDWELEGMEDYVVEDGDVFTFTSTLHGG